VRPSHPGKAAVVGALSAGLVVAACQYSFSNPVEQLGAGQVSGRTVADLMATGEVEPAGGVAVSIKGSAFDQVTHPTGRFTMIPLPVGRHTLLFRKSTELALVRSVEVRSRPDGQPDGVLLGDVLLPPAASVGGVVAGAPAADGGLVVDEESGLTASVRRDGDYRLDGMSLGEHVLKFGVIEYGAGIEWVGGPVVVRLDPTAASSLVQLADTPVRPATAATGRLRFRVVSLHGGISTADVLITVEGLLRGPLPAADIPAPDSDGQVEIDPPEGTYRIRIAAPAPLASEVTAPPPAAAVVISGEVADLGALYLVPPGVPAAAQALCQEQADCGRSDCTGGSCVGYTAPLIAPAGLPFCDVSGNVCGAGAPVCTGLNGEAGWCNNVGNARYSCVPCGTSCTTDGQAVYQGGC
jgi:hypothetical protein